MMLRRRAPAQENKRGKEIGMENIGKEANDDPGMKEKGPVIT